jgi:hypothetical protein
LKTYIYFLTACIVLFSACSTKEVYEPKVLSSDWEHTSAMQSALIDRASNVALLENRHVLTKDGELDLRVEKGFRVIGISDKHLISASIDGNLSIVSLDGKEKEQISLKKTVAAASIKANMLAVVFANNDIALYDLQSKKILFKEQGGRSIVNDMRIVNPYFLDELVLFATLDGKIIVVNTKLKKRLRTILVSSEEYFNNIIYFNILENKILTASSYKLLAMAQKELRKKYEIRNILFDKSLIYITTKEGEIIALTPSLQVDSKIKLPFAHFLGMIDHNGKLYILEKEGYMIVVDKKTFAYSVHEVDIDDGFVFVGKDLFYVDDRKISIE